MKNTNSLLFAFCTFIICISSNLSASNSAISIVFDEHLNRIQNIDIQIDSIEQDTLYFDLGDGDIIKVPTVFTPNDDGIDDLFYPRFDNQRISISQYSIYIPEASARVMYSAKKLIYKEDQTVKRAWDGTSKYTKAPYESNYEGPFKFRFAANRYDAEGKHTGFLYCKGTARVDRTL